MRKPAININDLLAVTKEPRRYELVVLQQPEVARCSPLNDKDRRPVDPPPILQLRIYDKDGKLDDRWEFVQRDDSSDEDNLQRIKMAILGLAYQPSNAHTIRKTTPAI